MISEVAKTSLISLSIGFLVEIAGSWLSSDFLSSFFKANLITILVALLAVNAATMGIVLTKIRDLIDKSGKQDSRNYFLNTRSQMLLSVKEQIGLIAVAVSVLILQDSLVVSKLPNSELLIHSVLTAVFVYALLVLYDTAKGVLIIVDFDVPEK
ncbi:hypothetical protein [Aliamphritea hakodatensis]|uniref:hypothetical protein n=1 Tax=Aliamphritea hakodatensis TaxID=2895352 RepID=UPI0022FDA360|nr:hypothetical protein [Aliamphritea hakodatensis]